MGDGLYLGFREVYGRLHRVQTSFSPCNRPPTQTHEAHNQPFISTLDDVPIDNTSDFELHNLDVVGLRHDKVSRIELAKIRSDL